MKIQYHHRTLGDGAEGIHVSSMIEAFRALGHEVRVASLVGEATALSTFRVRIFSHMKEWTPRSLYELLEMSYSVVGYRLLTRHTNDWRPELLYERYTLFNLSGLMAARRIGIPFVVEINAPLAYERAQYEHLALKRVAIAFERFLCSRADLVIAVSTPLKDYLVRKGVPSERVVVLPNGTDPKRFRPDSAWRKTIRSKLGISRNTIVVGFVGILRPWHGVELLIDALSRLRHGNDTIRVLIVGDGPVQSELETLVRCRGLNMVTFVGRVLHEDVPRYLAAFDIGVSPRATFYACPMKVLEYMAAGMAVVAPRMSNLKDIIVDGVDGVLFQPEDAADLAVVLAFLIRNHQVRANLGQHARAAVLRGRTWQHNARRILDLVNCRVK